MKNTRFYIYTISLLVITMNLWYLSKDSLSTLSDFPFKSASQIFALWASVLLAFELILTSRAKWLEKILGPLDQVYKYHRYLSIFSVIAMIVHVTTLILNSQTIGGITSIYLIPSNSNLAYFAGIISFYLFITTIAVTIYIKLPYHIWKLTHRILAMSTLLATYHIITIGSDIQNSLPLKLWILGMLSIGILSMLYKVFLYKYIAEKNIYTISEIRSTQEILRISLKAKGKKLKYKAGQFAYFTFISKNITKEEHPFSIVSNPKEEELVLGIKMLGDYSRKLTNLKVGDTVYARGAYGFFGRRKSGIKKEIWLGAGVGITPLLSLDTQTETKLYYLKRNNNDDSFNSDIERKYKDSNGQLEVNIHSSNIMGRFKIQDLSQEGLERKDTLLRVCAPKSIIDELIELYQRNKYPIENLIYEDFNLFN